MITNVQSIIIDKPIPGLTGVTFNKCTTLADVLAAMILQGGPDIHATSGSYDPIMENLVISLSNGGSFTIPASLLLPVVADGVTITGNGTNANKLVGYQVAYDAATGALTITPPPGGGAATVVPAQTATEEKAADPHNLLGLGIGATVTTQQMLDYLAAHLRDCCPSKTLEIPTTAFANPANPTQAEADAWINAQNALGPGTQIVYNRPGNPAANIEDPDYVWLVNEIGDATNVESPACCPDPTVTMSGYVINNPDNPQQTEVEAYVAANGPYQPGTLIRYIGSGTLNTPNTVWQIDRAGNPIRTQANYPSAMPIPASAFADSTNPTQLEAELWVGQTGAYPPNTLFTYSANGSSTDPDYVWQNAADNTLINLESPAPTHAGASLINATATGLVQNVAQNPAFSQIVYAENATATTGANSSITIQSSGRYLINAAVWWASENWTYECGMHGFINVNGVIMRAGGRLDHSRKLLVDPVNSGASKFLSYTTAINCILNLNAGDIVTFTVIHDDIVSHNLLTNNGYSWFEVEKLT